MNLTLFRRAKTLTSAAQTEVVNDPVAREINARIKPAGKIVAMLNTGQILTSTPRKKEKGKRGRTQLSRQIEPSS
jgi:hypothetical protein